jgi:hypothetical protein
MQPQRQRRVKLSAAATRVKELSMEELVPSAWLTGMDGPRRWMHAVAARLSVRPPCAPAQWLPPPADGAALRWYEPLGHELVTIFLFEKPDQIELGVWSTAWSDDMVSYAMYRELVTTVTTLLIDQYADQDGPLVRLQVQPYDETQAPLKDSDDGGLTR